MRFTYLLARCSGIGLLLCVVGGCGAIAGDGPPACEIVTPAEEVNTAFSGDAVAFAAHGTDGDTTTNLIGIAWTSSLGDPLPSGTLDLAGDHSFSTNDLSIGEHTIMATVTDGQGETCTDTVAVSVVTGGIPTIVIDTPRSEGFYYDDLALTLQARVSDAEDAPADLRVHWAVEDGVGLAEGLVPDIEGVTSIERVFEIARHVLEATVVDTHGNIGTAWVVVTVGGPNQPPDCVFLSPLEGASVTYGVNLELLADATDPNVPSTTLAVAFDSNVDGPLGVTTPNDSGDVSLIVPTLSIGEHELTILVTDDRGVTCDDSVTILVDEPPLAEITTPTSGTVPSDNLDLVLQGLASDREDPPETLTVAWYSDVAGLLADAPPDSAGLLDDRAAAGLARGQHTITLEVTDSLGSVATDSVTVIVNGAPGSPGVLLVPGGPTTIDALESSVFAAATDPDGDPLTYVFSWLVDTLPDPAQDGLETIPATSTAKGETWRTEVRAFDGYTLGEPGWAEVLIDNTPPQGGSATVSPTLGTSTDIYSLTTTGWADVDGDTEDYQYQWVLNGVAVLGETNATYVPGVGTPEGSPLHCEVTPWDGQDIGVMFLSSPAFINQPATVATVTISPVTAYETDTLIFSFTGGADPEGNATTLDLQWYEGQTTPVAIPGAVGSTLTGTDFNHFDFIRLGVAVHDGVELGPETLSNVVEILNTVPIMAPPTLQPTLLYTNTTAICTPGTVTEPDLDTVTPQYEWLVGGSPVVGQTTSVLDGSVHFDKNQTVRCVVTPYDGYDWGTPQESGLYLVQNSPPTQPVVEITPSTPGDDNPLSCSTAVPSLDLDNDTVSYSRSWTLFGTGTPFTAQNLLANATTIGDVWTCTMTPWDGSALGPLDTDTVTIQASQIMSPGGAGSTYSQSTQTRGMWFEAPVAFTITGLWIPAETNAGDFQNVQVLLLPSTWTIGSSTSSATSLFHASQQAPGSFVVTNIPILAGEKIGVLGARGTSTMHSMYSPGNAPVATTLDGTTVQLYRLEYNDSLWAFPAGLVTDDTGPIGRVEVELIP
jgi:hypothetical protein